MKMLFSVLLPSGSRMSTDLDIQRSLLGSSDLNMQEYTGNAAARCLVSRFEIFRVQSGFPSLCPARISEASA